MTQKGKTPKISRFISGAYGIRTRIYAIPQDTVFSQIFKKESVYRSF